MNKNREEKMKSAIEFLTEQGYIIGIYYKHLIGKWAAFHQEGMVPVLHGKVKEVSIDGYCTIRCKNGEKRYVNINDVIGFYDDKEACYMIKAREEK